LVLFKIISEEKLKTNGTLFDFFLVFLNQPYTKEFTNMFSFANVDVSLFFLLIMR